MTVRVIGVEDPGALDAVVAALGAGAVVAIPTDTVYGLAVDPAQPGASDRLFAAKERPRAVELPVLVSDDAQARSLAGDLDPGAVRLMARWWPGPLTVVVARRPGLTLDLGDNPATIGVRCPDHGFVRAVCSRFGPIATTSANRHGGSPLTEAAGVVAELGDSVALVVDGGTCDRPPSTVVDVTGAQVRVLREGAVPSTMIEETLK